MKTYHLPLLVQVLQWVFGKGMQADKAIEQLFKTYELNGFDKRMLHENFYEVVRWWRLLVQVNNGNASLQDDNVIRLIGINLIRKDRNLPEHNALNKLSIKSTQEKLVKVAADPGVRHSVPEWMEERCRKELGDQWDEIAEGLNENPQLSLRINTLKATADEVGDFLREEEVEFHHSQVSADGIVLEDFRNVYRTHPFKEGWIEVQDEGSQRVGEFLDAKAGMRVIDACAGAGGKSLHLAALMKNKGKIIALDIYPQKLEELKRRAKRAGIENIEIRPIENSKTIKRMKQTADRVLIDAPCSGLGVLRRNPDIKWRTNPDELVKIEALQRQLLEQFSATVKPGGKLVYATCSILPSENENQVQQFLAGHPEFELEKEERLFPHLHGCDGFYMARLNRKVTAE